MVIILTSASLVAHMKSKPTSIEETNHISRSIDVVAFLVNHFENGVQDFKIFLRFRDFFKVLRFFSHNFSVTQTVDNSDITVKCYCDC